PALHEALYFGSRAGLATIATSLSASTALATNAVAATCPAPVRQRAASGAREPASSPVASNTALSFSQVRFHGVTVRLSNVARSPGYSTVVPKVTRRSPSVLG